MARILERAGKAIRKALNTVVVPPAGVVEPPKVDEPGKRESAPRKMAETMSAEHQRDRLIEWFERRFQCAYGPDSGVDLRYATFALRTQLDDGAYVRLATAVRERFSAIPEGTPCYWRMPGDLRVVMFSDLNVGVSYVTFRAVFPTLASDLTGIPLKAEGSEMETI